MSDAHTSGPPILVLMRLGDGCPALTPDCGRSLAEAAAVCLDERGHESQADLLVVGDYETAFRLVRPSVTDQMRRCYNDPDVATELGACGIAVLLIRELVGFTIVERSRKGTGFDYWLGEDGDDLFASKARLEVSGIRAGDETLLMSRVKRKLQQTQRSDDFSLPAYVVVVEFNGPMVNVTQR